MNQTVHIGGHPYRVVGKAPLAAVSRACYGRYRFTLQRISDGSLWQSFGVRVNPASELLRR